MELNVKKCMDELTAPKPLPSNVLEFKPEKYASLKEGGA
jgi:hypothetical protein